MLLERQELQAQPVRSDNVEVQAIQEALVQRDRREIRVTQVVRVRLETLVLLDLKVPKDRRVLKDQ